VKKHVLLLLVIAAFAGMTFFYFQEGKFASPQTAVAAAESDDDDDATEESSGDYSFTVKKGTLSMPDGVKLAVSYWMPQSSEAGEKFPVFFEMNGYRKDDLCYLSWDYPVGAWFARHGYVVAKVDLRGTGASEGVLPPEEYSEQELADGVEVVRQLAAKEFSNGKVGMYGLSWGAFNSLMIARRKPPALKAILIAHVSDDLYYQDVHFVDGVMHTDVWESMIDSYNALPDTDGYELSADFYKERFDQPPWHYIWKEHSGDSPFWRKESGRFQPDVQVPVYVIGGLLDGYRDTVVRLLNSSNKQIKADIGPWKHEWPHDGTPGPRYEWRRKALRWFDYWLKDFDNGVMREPRFMVFVRDAVPASEDIKTTPGQWRCGNWPVGGIKPQRFYTGQDNKLVSAAPAGLKPCSLAYKAGAGMSLHGWWGETSGDMSEDDESSLVFDSAPLNKTVEIIGIPKVNLSVSADAPVYQWSVRLEDVWPDESVSLVSGTLINPADRVSRLKQTPLVPGQQTKIAGEIHFTTWRFRPGHKIRLAVSNAQFPTAWPSPYKGSTKLYPGPDSSVELPVVEQNTLTATCSLPAPEKEEWPPDASYDEQDEGDRSHIEYDKETGTAVYSCGINQKMTIGHTGYHMQEQNTWKVNDRDPAHASYDAVTNYSITPPDRDLHLVSKFHVGSDEKNFRVTVSRQLYEDKELVREKKWDKTIPRNYQ
jgi:uncharacterized protein